MPVSAVDVVRPAFERTVQQLFKPFRLGQWIRLAFTGLLAGELGTAGGCSLRVPWLPTGRSGSQQFLAQTVIPTNMFWFVGALLLIALVSVVIIALIYVSSRMRFVLFDSVIAKECHIRRFWQERGTPAFRYFIFQLLFSLSMLGGFAFFVAIAAIIAFSTGWYRSPGEHIVPLILVGVVLVFFLAVFIIIAVAISVLTKDFVVPQMALEGVSVLEGWRRLWYMAMTEKAGYAGYVGIKFLLTIVAAIIVGIGSLILVVALLIPAALLALIAVFGARAIGLAWNIYTISVAIAAGCVALAAIVFGVLLISVPTVVFFPSYSIYFLAERYQPLRTAMFPPLSPPETAGG